MYRILVINPGGLTTKLAVYEDKKCVLEYSKKHTQEEIDQGPLSWQQVIWRKDAILAWLQENEWTMDDFDALAVRGAPSSETTFGGTYLVKGRYRDAVMKLYHPDEVPIHGTRMTCAIAEALIGDRDIPIFVTDPGSVNELKPVARICGVKGYTRFASFHALNQKATARKFAEKIGKPYKDCRVIVAHLGSGITVGAHEGGKVVEVNNGGMGYGPMSPQRAGTVATSIMLELCFDKGYTREQVQRMVRGEAGVMALLGTDNMQEVEAMIQKGDEKAELVFNSMAYQIAKEIGSCTAALRGKVDGICITGAIAHSKRLVEEITSYVSTFAPVHVFPGEFENEALAFGAYRVLTGEEEPIPYDRLMEAEDGVK